ncbi:heme-copper oxidase subunit III [Peredibacter sp. HCB2-198]|uniref:cytochrome c oxidase subunit 3 n=1 Tax=Peredibacter sp. HCB2-198 TaxID=3383025 RepID=UPI0038B59B42
MMKNPANEYKRFQNTVAMTVTLITFGMLFGTLFLGYFLARFNAPTWPPVEIENMPKLLPFLNTLVMALSSYTYFKMEREEDKRKTFWWATFGLGILFLVLQWFLWNALAASGILVSNGQVPSMVYGFTWLHAGHIVMALMTLLWLGRYIFRKPQELTDIKLVNVGKFWHFLGVVWLLMYLMLFVL